VLLFAFVIFCVSRVVTSVCAFLGNEGPGGPFEAVYPAFGDISFAGQRDEVNSRA